MESYNLTSFDQFDGRFYLHKAARYGRKGLFLDRDGVLNRDHGYVGSIDRVDIMAGVLEALQLSCEHDIAIVIVTNQSGISREFYQWADFEDVCQLFGRPLHVQARWSGKYLGANIVEALNIHHGVQFHK